MDIFDTLLKHFPWEASEQQIEAFKEISYFLEKKIKPRQEDFSFILKGYAGTGKTTMISTLVKSAPKIGYRPVLLAPTGRAAKVMSQYSGRKAMTIHKRIYRQKKSVGLDFSFELAHHSLKNALFIVDEASMIHHEKSSFKGRSLLEDLIKYIKKGENCKLILVGDTAQLPPVGMVISPALVEEEISHLTQSTCRSIELSDVIRQEKESGILYNATLIRNLIDDSKESKDGFPKFKTQGFQDIYKMGGKRLIEGLHYAYEKFGMEETLVICRSNKHANLYNMHIRNQILFRDEELSGGDLIMVVKNNYHWQDTDEGDKQEFIANGDMAKLIRVRNIHEQYGFRFADVQLRFLDQDEDKEKDIECRVILDTLYSESPNLSYEDQKRLYEEVLNDYNHLGTQAKKLQALKSDPYYNALQIKFSMAVTCHKAQGGQWKAVFVDQGYFTEDMLNKDYYRWLYTACSRATDELYLVNFDFKFFE